MVDSDPPAVSRGAADPAKPPGPAADAVVSGGAAARGTRAQQRANTEGRILAAARELFAEQGYERTTIRAVAARAGVDAGLVMHYFHSKDELFTTAAKLPPDELPTGGTPADVAQALLASLGRRLVAEPVASLAVLRSMFTHSEAAEGFRAAGRERVSQIGAAIPARDAELRAGLLSAITHGVVTERYLLRTSLLAEAEPEEIIDLLRPCFEALVGSPDVRARDAPDAPDAGRIPGRSETVSVREPGDPTDVSDARRRTRPSAPG
ncbi:hypothetical protein FAIPA1_10275 [Frankia sp. AiPs1]|uniref:TetR/AcrR family transcriptional regulator n=1 Tax=Frankia sp. AiPa1 TaxID=573492 RepID=UPI00202B9B69|nr:TetR/AcrR family transcriptional regulator [Frankia sp. AiPa1]MCL9762872.1 TetR/AcrR family transcriptional regulator [Frankia sp. AiPa1]